MTRGPDWGVVGIALALLVVLSGNLLGIWRDHGALEAAKAPAAAALAQAKRGETQLEALARGTQALAAAGNPNARAVVAVMAQNGIAVGPRAR